MEQPACPQALATSWISRSPQPGQGDRARAGARRPRGARVVTNTRAGRTLWVAAAGTSLVLAVFSAVVVTIGDSARSLHAGTGGTAWALSGMSLGLAISLLTAGALADDVGHRCVLMWSAGLLMASSVVGALATSMPELVAARVVQGIGGGGVLAASLGSIGSAF